MDAVILLVDDQFVGIDRSAPFSIRLATTKLPVGDHELVGLAFDTTGNFTETTPAKVHVQNERHDSSCNTAFPRNTFRACFYGEDDTTGPYLGSWFDGGSRTRPRMWRQVPRTSSANVVAFGRADHITGVWRGSFDFPPGLYWFRFHTDDGLKVWIDGNLVIDAWYAPQIADPLAEVNLSGRAKVKVSWFESDGGAALSPRWSPPTT